MTDITFTLTGWTHVHTWQESHGAYTTAIYQREIDPRAFGRRVELLEISTPQRGTTNVGHTVRTEIGGFAHDYLLARDIRADADRYRPTGKRHIDPCCTAGSDDFEDTQTGDRYRVVGVAGHGEWAFKLTDADVEA